MVQMPAVQSLSSLLDDSHVTPEFHTAVRGLERGIPSPLIRLATNLPSVKVLRVICKILEMMPNDPIESMELRAVSGCSNFTGSATLQPGDVTVEFDWDCRWRAQQQGWTDPFGDPDQIRAAREFGYQCFADFRISRPGATGEGIG